MLKVVMSWMVKKLRWFLILLVIHPIPLLPSLLPRDSKVKSSPVPPELPNPLLPPFLLLVTTMSLTLLLDGCSNPTWSQVGANWPRHIFMANWPPSVFYGIHAITPSHGHILPSLAFLANSHFTNPQAFIFDFGPGGSFCLLGASRPPSHHLWIQGHPFH
ncbi:hypothetical protein O181_098141 [Austropuccinia psidii MF-1]|uniref:Uncharacterized protein n=1 Tax=Austropuccinia psidii MF-1 TaxID=1389203 RepID=A0A9Q3PFP7_9BASI|nr:hypothetical protein [Austropuccinia psidii MF-1]